VRRREALNQSIIERSPLKVASQLGTFGRPVVERIRSWGVVGTLTRAAAGALVAFATLFMLVIANPPDETGAGSWRTTNSGSAIDDPGSFIANLLDAATLAGWLFIVASGFSLIFGLMRVVNMAHGAFYLLGGYIAYEIQQRLTAETPGFIPGELVTTWEWLIPMAVAMLCIGGLGLVIQQGLLRWNQGQDLRQALITIALSVIIADQVIAHFPRSGAFQTGGGNLATITWPGWTERRVDLRIAGVEYSLTRLAILALGVAVGVALWVWLQRTRTGMVIRAGVDDRQMTSALGINIQRTFAIAFFVGSALAAMGGTVGASQGGVASGQDGLWLLYSLVVVIVGGMGSLVGAAVGSVLVAFVLTFSASYLPSTGDPAGIECCTQYSITFTFVLIALVLAFRPQGLFGRAA
jgi:branched-chain amino acid transport system permease protein